MLSSIHHRLQSIANYFISRICDILQLLVSINWKLIWILPYEKLMHINICKPHSHLLTEALLVTSSYSELRFAQVKIYSDFSNTRAHLKHICYPSNINFRSREFFFRDRFCLQGLWQQIVLIKFHNILPTCIYSNIYTQYLFLRDYGIQAKPCAPHFKGFLTWLILKSKLIFSSFVVFDNRKADTATWLKWQLVSTQGEGISVNIHIDCHLYEMKSLIFSNNLSRIKKYFVKEVICQEKCRLM